MADDANTDADQAEEQLYAAIDTGAEEDDSDGEIYIAVDSSEAGWLDAVVGGGSASGHPSPADSGAMDQVTGETRPISLAEPGHGESAATKSAAESTRRTTESSSITSAPRVSAEGKEIELQGSSRGAEATPDQASREEPQILKSTTVSGHPDLSQPAISASASVPTTTNSSVVPRQRSDSPPEVQQSNAGSPETPSSKGETSFAALSHSIARNRERKEPAVLGEFVSLDEMEGRQHLRFASKSPETASHAPIPANVPTAPPTSVPASKAGKGAFTPFMSIISGATSVPPSPSPSGSGSHNKGNRKSQPSSPAGAGSGDAQEKQKKRPRDAVSPSSSAASFQTASSRIDEAMSKSKKPKKLGDRLHDRPQIISIGDGTERDGTETSTKLDAPAPAGLPSTSVREVSPDAERATPGSIDMDIDRETPSPARDLPTHQNAQSVSHSAASGTAAFNPNQEDFMAFDISDEEDEAAFQPSHLQNRGEKAGGPASESAPSNFFPGRAPLDKGKARAEDQGMCAECGGIMAHSETCSRSRICTSCNEVGHTAQYCSASWRDYVYHSTEEREAAIDRKSKIAEQGGWMYEAVGVLVLDGTVGQCYNCGRIGHWGDDCPDPHWNETHLQPTAFGEDNARHGPFAKNYLDQPGESDPLFVQSQKLLHESGSNRGANLRPGSMGRERQKQIMRHQAANARNGAEDEEDDDWFDKARKGGPAQFPGRGKRLGPGNPNNPRANGPANNRMAGNSAPGNSARFPSIQIRGMANNASGGNGPPSSGTNPEPRSYQFNQREQNRDGNSGSDRARNRGGRDYHPNDRDSAAHNFYSSGQGGGAVSEWESDYRRSDQHFRPAPSAGPPGPANDMHARDRNVDNGRSAGARGRGGTYQNRGRGYSGNDAQQSRAYGGQRQNYYGGY